MNSSIWEHFASGSFSPGTSPAFLSGPGAAELARLRQELEEANGTIKQWEESWKQAKQVWPRAWWHPTRSLTQGPGGGSRVLEDRAETWFCSPSPGRSLGGWCPRPGALGCSPGLVPAPLGLLRSPDSRAHIQVLGSEMGPLSGGSSSGPSPLPCPRRVSRRS